MVMVFDYVSMYLGIIHVVGAALGDLVHLCMGNGQSWNPRCCFRYTVIFR